MFCAIGQRLLLVFRMSGLGHHVGPCSNNNTYKCRGQIWRPIKLILNLKLILFPSRQNNNFGGFNRKPGQRLVLRNNSSVWKRRNVTPRVVRLKKEKKVDRTRRHHGLNNLKTTRHHGPVAGRLRLFSLQRAMLSFTYLCKKKSSLLLLLFFGGNDSPHSTDQNTPAAGTFHLPPVERKMLCLLKEEKKPIFDQVWDGMRSYLQIEMVTLFANSFHLALLPLQILQATVG